MTWTYAGAPGTSTSDELRDAVRLLTGDTDTNDQQITDEEITFFLSEAGDAIYKAASIACRSIAAKYGRLVDTALDSASNSFSQRQNHYLNLAERLDRQSKTTGGELGVPVAGGVSIGQMDSVEDNSDRPDPAFKRNQFNNPPGTRDLEEFDYD